MKRFRLYLVGGLLLCLLAFGFFSWLGNMLYPAVVRLELAGFEARFGVTKFISHWKAVDTLYSQVSECRVTLKELEIHRSVSALLTKENNELKELVSFVERQRFQVVTSEVYGYGIPGEFQAYFGIGSDDGIQMKDPVIATSGNVIGLISVVEPKRSIITFISSPDIALPVVTNNSAASIGVTQGGRGNEVSIGFIPQQQVIKNNDEILLPSSATILQRELYLGYVDSVTQNPSDIFQTAIVIIPEPFSMVTKASVAVR